MPFNKIRTIRWLFTCAAVLMTVGAAWLTIVAYSYAAGFPEADRLVTDARGLAERIQARQAGVTTLVLRACSGDTAAAAAYQGDLRELTIALGEGGRLTRKGAPADAFLDAQASLNRFLEVHDEVLAGCR